MNNLKIVRTKNKHILDPNKIPYVDRQILISIDNDKPSIYIDRVVENSAPSRLLLNGSFHFVATKSALVNEEIKDQKVLYLVTGDPVDVNNGFYQFTGVLNNPINIDESFELIDVFGKINTISINGGNPLPIVNKHVDIPVPKLIIIPD